MSDAKMRSWWWHRQGLDGSLHRALPAEVLERSGWARSVGGVGPYLSLFARAQITREAADEAVAKQAIHELPSVRGCTYVVPAKDYPLALALAQAFGQSEQKVAAKLGVTDQEITKLCRAIEKKLGDEPLSPEAIKDLVGAALRNLGDEGKKKGMTTTLPLALGILQAKGLIRRVPINGRLDQQRYNYVRWSPSPLATDQRPIHDVLVALAQRYFAWVGPATMKELQWFSGMGVKACKEACAALDLVAVADTERWMHRHDFAAYQRFEICKTPDYALVSSLDAISAARRDVATLIDSSDLDVFAKITFGEKTNGSLVDLPAHAIVDRGRLIGYWEYDFDQRQIVWLTFARKLRQDAMLREKVAQCEAFIRDQVGDARAFSLDSPKSRAPKVAAIRELGGSM